MRTIRHHTARSGAAPAGVGSLLNQELRRSLDDLAPAVSRVPSNIVEIKLRIGKRWNGRAEAPGACSHSVHYEIELLEHEFSLSPEWRDACHRGTSVGHVESPNQATYGTALRPDLRVGCIAKEQAWCGKMEHDSLLPTA